MTEKTATLSIRLKKEDKEKIAKRLTRRGIESIIAQIERGEIEITDEGVSVNTIGDYCKGCEYMENALDMSKFNEVCEFKGLDRQKALDKCVQMLWR